MSVLRLYLFCGLVIHKLVWELLRRRQRRAEPGVHAASLRVYLCKAVKLAVLVGILVQTLLPDVLPIMSAPFVIRVFGFLVYTAGLSAALAARIQLGRNWSDIENARVLEDQELVAQGIYRYMRHPIYVGDLLLLLGLELSLNSWLVLGPVLMTPFVLRQALREERMLAAKLPGYAEYCTRTRGFVPFPILRRNGRTVGTSIASRTE